MEQFAAGIIPYTIFNNEIYFLLGLEKSNNKWSGFVGKSEPGETPKQTAIREFNEETALIFNNISLENAKEPVIDITGTGKIVYLWFIEFPQNLLNVNFNDTLKRNQKKLGKHFNEKSKLSWISLHSIKQSNKIFYKLKVVLINNFK
jgi:8-oxo-dGTP pyrophosphatase MutT (NUDIX family)